MHKTDLFSTTGADFWRVAAHTVCFTSFSCSQMPMQRTIKGFSLHRSDCACREERWYRAQRWSSPRAVQPSCWSCDLKLTCPQKQRALYCNCGNGAMECVGCRRRRSFIDHILYTWRCRVQFVICIQPVPVLRSSAQSPCSGRRLVPPTFFWWVSQVENCPITLTSSFWVHL